MSVPPCWELGGGRNDWEEGATTHMHKQARVRTSNAGRFQSYIVPIKALEYVCPSLLGPHAVTLRFQPLLPPYFSLYRGNQYPSNRTLLDDIEILWKSGSASNAGRSCQRSQRWQKVPLVGGAPLALSSPLSVRQQSHQLLGQQSATAMQSEPNCLANLTVVLRGMSGILSLD